MKGPSAATDEPPVLHGAARESLRDARFVPVASGHRSRVWRASYDDDRADLAVKTVPPRHDGPAPAAAFRAETVALIHAEADRLAWVTEHLAGRGVPVPELVVAPEAGDPDPILVTTWVEGTVDPRMVRSPEVAVELFARTLASLHEASRRIDLDACPFDASLDHLLDHAADRIDRGLVDTSRLEDPYDRYTPTELLDRVHQMATTAAAPGAEDRVLVHGDLCVTNVVLDPAYSTAAGVIDWAHAGVGDRHQDLAITARSLARNLSGEVLPDFFDAYGLSDPDLLRIETYAALEELF